METKHTQGEWEIRSDCRDTVNGRGFIQIGTNKCTWIAEAKGTHVGPLSEEECEANAKLIAAAPDMLNAIINLLKEEAVYNFYGQSFPAIQDLKNAIKKATN
jgi:hypothetical protein